MLDKSIPYKEIWMKRPLDLVLPDYVLPEGYQLVFYQAGMEKDWAKIETAVLEFAEVAEAQAYFQKSFAPYPDQLASRMLFVEDPAGKRVGTCTAWFSGEKPLIHWVAVIPEAQGQGLAKALLGKALRIFQEQDQSDFVYLHTQTWSHDAIALYQKLGFVIMSENLDGSTNEDYQDAMKILAAFE